MSNDAELLRRAAERIRNRAKFAAPSPWAYDDRHDRVTFEGRQNHRENLHPQHIADVWGESGHHIALWSPDVAHLIALAFDDDARQLESGSCDEPGSVDRSVELARLILRDPA